MCPTGMPLPMLLQICRHNFLDQVVIRMGAVKAHTWKELVEQAEIAEKSAKKFESSTLKGKWGMNNKGATRWQNLPKPKGKRLCPLSCQEIFLRRPRKVASIIRSLSFLRSSTPSKMSRCLQYSTYSKRE